MGKFKVGDRVRVVAPDVDRVRPDYIGMEAVVDEVYEDGSGYGAYFGKESWGLREEEIEFANITPETITLRDQFAMAALTGLCADSGTAGVTVDVMARTSYALADAMLAERERASK